MQKSDQMVLKGVNWINWVHNVNISHMVLKAVNWVHINKNMSNGLERSQLCTNRKIRQYGIENSQLGAQ